MGPHIRRSTACGGEIWARVTEFRSCVSGWGVFQKIGWTLADIQCALGLTSVQIEEMFRQFFRRE